MYHTTRDEELRFLKRIWRGETVTCPKCGKGTLTYLHKKAKKSNCDWKCPDCGEIYRTIQMLNALPEK